MKKTIALLSVFLMIVSSCTTNDDASQKQDTSILPKKIIYTEGSNSSTISLSYNGRKIKETTNDNGYKSVYTYTGDLITNVTSYKGAEIDNTTDYTYTNGILKSKLIVHFWTNTWGIKHTYKLRSVYIHNTDGTILEERYSVDSQTGVEKKLGNSEVYIFVNGNLTKQVYTYEYTHFNGIVSTTTIYKNTYIFEYDKKNNPAVNILGFNKIGFSENYSLNNLLKSTVSDESATNGITNAGTPVIINYTLSYNSSNYLTESTFVDSDGNNIFTYKNQYFYN